MKDMVNTADYAPYVNDSHRIVNKLVETIGCKWQFILEKVVHKVDKALLQEFRKGG